MTPPDDSDPDKIPTQPAMAAVRAPPSIEERVTRVEENFVTRADLQALADRQSAYEKACEEDRRALRNDVTQLTASVARVESKTDKIDVKSDKLDVKVSALMTKTDALEKHGEALVRIEAALVPAAQAVGVTAQETSKLIKLITENPRATALVSLLVGLVVAWLAKQLGVNLP